MIYNYDVFGDHCQKSADNPINSGDNLPDALPDVGVGEGDINKLTSRFTSDKVKAAKFIQFFDNSRLHKTGISVTNQAQPSYNIERQFPLAIIHCISRSSSSVGIQSKSQEKVDLAVFLLIN